ncbi:MAG TPA: ABC transporter ATP-binding protein [Micropepsaceae bacterium]|nr:ABC transporter ATP-binding protein [Micropepsaceae bacterium]
MSALAIDVHGLTKRFGPKIAVDGVDIAVPEGQVWGFLGPNGSGKTTTIRMLCGLLKPDAGEGTCLGHDVRKEPDAIKREVGYMTQRFSFWEDLSIRENLEFVARIYSVSDRTRKVDETLERLGLAERQKQLAGELSGGWKQRLALAACMLHDPKLLLLDEPTAGVDPQARREFWEEIHRLSQHGLTVLVSTHYMDEAERCDRIVYISLGKIVTRGTVPDVIRQSGLITFLVEGRDVRRFLPELEGKRGVEHVAFFGAALHVSGRDRALLDAAVGPLKGQADVQIHEATPSLEDVFIYLQGAKG